MTTLLYSFDEKLDTYLIRTLQSISNTIYSTNIWIKGIESKMNFISKFNLVFNWFILLK